MREHPRKFRHISTHEWHHHVRPTSVSACHALQCHKYIWYLVPVQWKFLAPVYIVPRTARLTTRERTTRRRRGRQPDRPDSYAASGVAGVDRGGGQGMFRRPSARGSSEGEGPLAGDGDTNHLQCGRRAPCVRQRPAAGAGGPQRATLDARRAGHDSDKVRVRDVRPALVPAVGVGLCLACVRCEHPCPGDNVEL